MQSLVVETSYGKVSGALQEGICAFKGIPYGAPTGGHRRFTSPVAPDPWSGVRDATDFGPASPQLTFVQSIQGCATYQMLAEQVARGYDLGGRALHVAREALGGEDLSQSQGEACLTLNVWTPGIDHSRRPVMVYFHGGGWVGGAGSFDVSGLARQGDVVLVTVNHRLGLLGFLDLSERGEDYRDSGYAGVLDLVLALEWVRDNVANFGGDPSNVTIFGESGGGEKVAAMLALPQATGLFHRAIMQSCPAGSLFVGPDYSLRLADQVLFELGVNDVQRLSELPVEQLTEVQIVLMQQAFARAATAASQGVRPFFGEPLIIAPRLPIAMDDYISAIAASPTSMEVPLMIGTLSDETALIPPSLSRDVLSGAILDEESLPHALAPQLGSDTQSILSSYRMSYPHAEPADLLTMITTDLFIRVPSIRLAQRRATATGAAPVYMYAVDFQTPCLGGPPKAFHGMDVPMLFEFFDVFPLASFDDTARAVARRMGMTWTAFARNGNPNHAETPEWPAYTADDRSTMVFDQPCRIVADPRAAGRQAWERFSDRQLGGGTDCT